MCFTDAVSGPELVAQLSARGVRAGAALRRGQLRVAAAGDAFVGAGMVTAAGMVQVLARDIATAGQEGYPGLRVAADMGWATHPLAAAGELVTFESDEPPAASG